MQRSQRQSSSDDATPQPTDSAVRGVADESSGERARPDEERIARRAYERFEERGREHGHDLEDWFEAERELTRGE